MSESGLTLKLLLILARCRRSLPPRPEAVNTKYCIVMQFKSHHKDACKAQQDEDHLRRICIFL